MEDEALCVCVWHSMASMIHDGLHNIRSSHPGEEICLRLVPLDAMCEYAYDIFTLIDNAWT